MQVVLTRQIFDSSKISEIKKKYKNVRCDITKTRKKWQIYESNTQIDWLLLQYILWQLVSGFSPFSQVFNLHGPKTWMIC